MSKNQATFLARMGSKTPPSVSNPLNMPLHLSSSFDFNTVADLDDVYESQKEGFVYTRMDNPGHAVLAQAIAELEGCEAGWVFSSGMAAITMSLLSLLKSGDHVVASSVLYGETYMFLKYELAKFGIETTFVNLEEAESESVFKENTKLLYIETVSNPLIGITDIHKASEMAHRYGAKVMIDNTFASPMMCNPAALGADIIIHSGTKYLCGHGDLTCGLVVSDRKTIRQIGDTGVLYGTLASPFDVWLLTRSLKTLEMRMKKHCSNALELAKFFLNQPMVERVYYPGLEDSTYKGLAESQFTPGMYGGMLSIELKGGLDAAVQVIDRLEGIKLLPSLADASTTVILPAKTSHRALSPDELKAAGIAAGLVRISTGLEDVEDLKAEFHKALNGR